MLAELTKEEVQVQNLIAGCTACDRHAYSHRMTLATLAVLRGNGAETLTFEREMPTPGSDEHPPREGRTRPNPATDAPTAVSKRKTNPHREKEGQPAAPEKKKPNTNLRE